MMPHSVEFWALVDAHLVSVSTVRGRSGARRRHNQQKVAYGLDTRPHLRARRPLDVDRFRDRLSHALAASCLD